MSKSLYPAKCYWCEYPAFEVGLESDGLIMLCKIHKKGYVIV